MHGGALKNLQEKVITSGLASPHTVVDAVFPRVASAAHPPRPSVAEAGPSCTRGHLGSSSWAKLVWVSARSPSQGGLRPRSLTDPAQITSLLPTCCATSLRRYEHLARTWQPGRGQVSSLLAQIPADPAQRRSAASHLRCL